MNKQSTTKQGANMEHHQLGKEAIKPTNGTSEELIQRLLDENLELKAIIRSMKEPKPKKSG